jgi:hypothetical protein
MAGELWNQQWEIGNETTPGTFVARTRQMYFEPDSKLTLERTLHPYRFATASRDNQRAASLGPQMVGGTLTMPLSASEIIEFLLMTIKNDITPTGGTAKLWTFTPGTNVEYATLGWHDGARAWRAAGVMGSKLKFSGSVKDTAKVEMEVLGYSMAQAALTGGLTARVPDVIEGWETKLYIDAYAATPGTTAVTGTLLNWEVEIDNQAARKYFANNTTALGAVALGELAVKAKLTFEASSATSLTEEANWESVTKRLVRLEFGQNEIIAASDKKFVTIDLPGAWESVDLGQTDENTRAYEFSLDYIYDTTNLFGLQIRAQNARTAAW